MEVMVGIVLGAALAIGIMQINGCSNDCIYNYEELQEEYPYLITESLLTIAMFKDKDDRDTVIKYLNNLYPWRCFKAEDK